MKILLSSLLFFAAPVAFANDMEALKVTEVITMNFGTVSYGGSASSALQLQNTGGVNITNISWKISGFGFSAKDNCPRALAPGQSCRILVRFVNTTPGPAMGELLVYTSDKNYKVNLYAVGQRDPMPNPPIPRP
ncbi:MAG: choice-of-anchor D domain-containing protein [Bdellovibrio sp.]